MTTSTNAARDVRVTVLCDVPDWAFHNVARNLQRIARPPYSLALRARHDWFGRPGAPDAIVANSDILVFLWRFDLLAFLDSLGSAGWRDLMRPDRCALVTLVYDHVYGDPDDLDALGNPFRLADVVAASSQRLCSHYCAAAHLPDIRRCVPDGVDLDLFSPSPAPERPPGTPLRIGWVGNSDWGITLGHDFKGKRSVFEPALDLLRQAGLAFTVHVADKAERRLPLHQMPDFYRNIDVLVCSSRFEGTPNPVLEAMACGCAVVSTDVGLVRDVFGPRQMDFLLSDHSPAALAEHLARLIREPGTLADLKRENLERRASLGWATRWPAWQALFEEARANVAARAGTDRALAAFRSRRKSPTARVRKLLATNRAAFRVYS